MRIRTLTIVVALMVIMASNAAFAHEGQHEPWSQALRVQDLQGTDPGFNSDTDLDGCPFISSDGKMLFMASTRAGGLGGIDIWVSTRKRASDPWGPAINVGAPVNSAANDFCPTLAGDGRTFLFVSNRAGHCGTTANADIYLTRMIDKSALGTADPVFAPVNRLACDVDGGPNSSAEEASPFPIWEHKNGILLYFSSTRTGSGDIYVSALSWRGFGVAAQVPGLNTGFAEGQPNVRMDGKEIFFFSNRPDAEAQGSNDIYSSTRSKTTAQWSTPVNLGPLVNSAASETRPSLSFNGETLYFGSTRTGAGDIYVTTRD